MLDRPYLMNPSLFGLALVFFLALVFVLAVVFLSGCGAKSPSYEIVSRERESTFEDRARLDQNASSAIVVGFETSLDQVRQEIDGFSKSFSIVPSDDFEVAERVEMFFSQFTKNGLALRHASDSGLVFSNIDNSKRAAADKKSSKGEANADNYRYVIEKRYQPGAVTYRVICSPAGPNARSDLAERNAKNVARFIRQGELEASLLAQ